VTKYDSKIYSLRGRDFIEIIMNFIPIHLDKETFIQYLYIIKNKPEVLLKTQENKKDLMQNILLLCSLPCCMTKFYKKYLEDYKVPIKDNINLSKIDVFYQLSRLLLTKTKGKIIVVFPLHDKVYRENDSLLRKIRNEISKIFFSNVNPDDKEINLEERRRNFFCFLMDEEGLFEEIKYTENAKYPTNIIIFNMFLQNKNTGEFFNLITRNKYRHKIILYQLYISNLIEGKLSQVFYSKLNQFIEICASPLRKMKTTVYGQLTLSDKEIITITDLKKTFEKEISETNFNDLNDEMDYNNRNDISKINIVTSYHDLISAQKNFDGFIYIKKNSYLICTNSNNINLRFDNIYSTFIGNVSFNNYDNTLLNNNNFQNNQNNNPSLLHNTNNTNTNTKNDDDISNKTYGGIQSYNENLTKYKKKKFYQELDFLKDESNFENLKTNRYDLTTVTNNDINNMNNNVINPGANINNQNMNNSENTGNINNNINLNPNMPLNMNNHSVNSPNTRGEEVLVLNELNENPSLLQGDNNLAKEKKKRGRKRKSEMGDTNNPISNNNLNTNNNNVIGELIQIPNDEDIEDMNSALSDEVRNNQNIIQNQMINNISSINVNNNELQENEANNIPVNLDEITEDYSDTLSENSQERAHLQDKKNLENNKAESQQMNIEENTNADSVNKNNDKNIDVINPGQNDENANQNNNKIVNPKDTEQIEKLINDSKFESSRDRLFKIYNYLLTKGFEEKTRRLYMKCLLNYGFPLVNEFDKFYTLFQLNAQHIKMKNIPNKTDSQLYYELVYFLLEEDESLDYNIFVFGEERTSLIRTKLLIIRQFQSFKDVTKAMYFFVKDRPGVLFGHIEPKLDDGYQRVQFVMAKLLSNLVSKSIKSGFLNYKSYIKDDDIIFDNIRIKKDGQTSVFNIREGIAKKNLWKTDERK
jgi:hypothetical protein